MNKDYGQGGQGYKQGYVNDNQGGRYVPPYLRGKAQESIPEGAPIPDYGGHHQYNSYVQDGYDHGGSMRKSQSFAAVQDYNSGGWGGNGYAQPPPGPPSRGRAGFNDGGYQRNSYQRGGGAAAAPRGDFSGGRGGGRHQYQGRFSYDRRSMHDEQQWQNQPAQQRGGGGRWDRLNDAPPPHEQHRAQAWTEQGPPDASLESELFSGMNSGINFDKYEEIPVEATGEDIPAPINLFADLSLHPWIEDNIKKSGYGRPTPVQKYSIPTLNTRRDLMSCAQTGSGKTAAFLVPVINRILQDGPSALMKSAIRPDGKRCQFPAALIISPTRELSLQIYNESRKFAYRTPIISALLYGGRENYKDQINKLRVCIHFLGRLTTSRSARCPHPHRHSWPSHRCHSTGIHRPGRVSIPCPGRGR
uniref:RNA helicase n=1 Tax=Steinernema glaseri TaxID=37863 RepID=A0A1I7Z6N6_9BILA